MFYEFNVDTIFPMVVSAIDRVGERFLENKGSIITESDLKCQIYSELRSFLREDEETFDPNIMGTSLHTEVAFYNPNERNRADMPVDIVILDPNRLV